MERIRDLSIILIIVKKLYISISPPSNVILKDGIANFNCWIRESIAYELSDEDFDILNQTENRKHKIGINYKKLIPKFFILNKDVRLTVTSASTNFWMNSIHAKERKILLFVNSAKIKKFKAGDNVVKATLVI